MQRKKKGRQSPQYKPTIFDGRAHAPKVAKLVMATFNVAWSVQILNNTPKDNSAKRTVDRMLAAKAPKGGLNAAKFMASLQVDLLGVQEMVRGKQFAGFMGKDYGWHQISTSAVLYRKSTLGQVEHLGYL